MIIKPITILLADLTLLVSSYKVLISCGIATRSHAKALLEIGDHLSSLGHEVVFALQQNNIRFSKGYNVSNRILPGDTKFANDLKFDKDDKGNNIEANHKLLLDAMPGFMYTFYDLNYPGLSQLVKEESFDLFMCDYMAFACQDIAKEKRIPLVVGHQAMDYMMEIKSTYQTGIVQYGPLTTEELSFFDRYYYQFLEPLKQINVYINMLNSLKQARDKYGAKGNALFEDNKYALNIINSFFGFETATSIPPNYYVLGPLSTLPKEPLDSNISQFLDNRSKVLYIAFGSVNELGSNTMTALLQAVLHAIEANIIDGIIWGLGKTTSNNLPEVITPPNSNKQYDTKKLFNNQYANIKLLKWAQQHQILNHKNTKLFLTHGGLESISEATLTSTPMLCLPIFGDQPRNAKKVEYMGTGLYLDPENLNLENIISKIDIIIQDKDNEFEINLKKMKLLTNNPEKRIQQASELVIKHVELSKLCRLKHPFNEDDVVPCELNHLIHNASLLNPIFKYNIDIYLVNIVISIFIVYLVFKVIIFILRYVFNSLFSAKNKVNKVD